jgi:hypothetical protein
VDKGRKKKIYHLFFDYTVPITIDIDDEV